MTIGHAKISAGVEGIDEVLDGGFIPNRAYMVRGGAGTGKTTLGLHFLAAGGECGLLVSLAESGDQIRADAVAQGFDFSNIRTVDLAPTADALLESESYDLMSPSDVEKDSLIETIVEEVDKHRPKRVFIDSLTQIRYLTSDAYQFRKQVISLLHYLCRGGATVLFSSESGPEAPDDDLVFLSDGVLEVGWTVTGERRWFRVSKYRGSRFAEGNHGMTLDVSGVTVYPQLVPGEHVRGFTPETVSTGVPQLDELLHGGIERGTTTIITGPTGAGKTTLGAQLMSAAAARGERSVMYMFEEQLTTLLHRCDAIGIPARSMMEDGNLGVEVVEPLAYSADHFASMVRHEVEQRDAQIVMLDSLAGYGLSIGGDDLVRRLHALCRYLVGRGVTVVVINEVQSITGGELRLSELGISYLADAVMMLRYMEMEGELRKCIGVLKKRTGDFEKTLREFNIGANGVAVGPPMRQMRGILRGEPERLDRSSTEGRPA